MCIMAYLFNHSLLVIQTIRLLPQRISVRGYSMIYIYTFSKHACCNTYLVWFYILADIANARKIFCEIPI